MEDRINREAQRLAAQRQAAKQKKGHEAAEHQRRTKEAMLRRTQQGSQVRSLATRFIPWAKSSNIPFSTPPVRKYRGTKMHSYPVHLLIQGWRLGAFTESGGEGYGAWSHALQLWAVPSGRLIIVSHVGWWSRNRRPNDYDLGVFSPGMIEQAIIEIIAERPHLKWTS